VYCRNKTIDSTTKDWDEARRKRTGIPEERWGKMTDAEKADAVKKAEPPKSK